MPGIPITLLANIGTYGVSAGEVTGILEFDLLLSESHNFQNTVTSHAVENGSEVNDHIKNNLRTGSLTGMVSAYTIRLRAFDNVGNIITPLTFLDAEQQAFDALEKIWKARSTVTMVTMMRVYKNVAITEIRTGKSEADGKSITFEISFREVKQVSLKRLQVEAYIEINNLDDSLSKQVSPAENAGLQVGG